MPEVYPQCLLYGRTDDFDGFVSAVSSSLSLMSVEVNESHRIIEDISKSAFGVFKADAWLCRSIVDLVFSYDKSTGYATLVATSPSPVPVLLNSGPRVGEIFSMAASCLEEAVFAVNMIETPYQVADPGIGLVFFAHVTPTMKPSDFVVDEARLKTNPDDVYVPVKIEGMTSISQFALPYLKEMKDSAQASSGSSLKDLISLLQKLDSTPEEMVSMLEIEYGPVENVFWQAYAAAAQHDCDRDVELHCIYESFSRRSMRVVSPFTVETVSYQDQPLSVLMDDVREVIGSRGVDLEVSDVRQL